jgi:hypothetical protein
VSTGRPSAHNGLHTRPTFEKRQVDPKEKAVRGFAEPSDGLEPSTSSLPCLL